MTEIVQKRLSESVDHVMREFDRVGKPILQTLDLLEEANLAEDLQPKGTFFDRG